MTDALAKALGSNRCPNSIGHVAGCLLYVAQCQECAATDPSSLTSGMGALGRGACLSSHLKRRVSAFR